MKNKKRKNRRLKNRELAKCTGKWLKGCYKWLVKGGDGCCHLPFGESGTHEVCVCVGWTADGPEEYKVAWKIGWQTFDNGMQTDFDIDFDMPWNTKELCDRMNAKLTDDERRHGVRYVESDVYDTSELLRLEDGKTIPQGYRDWNALAAFVRKTARKVLAYAKEVDPEEGEE